MALESRQLVADDDTSEIWSSTGQIVHSRTKHEVTYNKIHSHHSENNALIIVLYQREPYRYNRTDEAPDYFVRVSFLLESSSLVDCPIHTAQEYNLLSTLH